MRYTLKNIAILTVAFFLTTATFSTSFAANVEVEMLNKQEEDERKKNIPIIEDLTNYRVNNYDDLLFLYKVKFFNNKINAGIELNTGNTIYFENVKEMDETEFFKLPVKGKGQIMKKRKLKKEFLEKKKNL